MFKLIVFDLFVFVWTVCGSDLFHVNSKVTFHPDDVSDYFGYSVLLSDMGLNIGAPKARSRVNKTISPGLVFTCPLDLDKANVTCNPIWKNVDRSRVRSTVPDDFYKDDMWFGATIAAVPKGKLMVCAPRITIPYLETHLLANGACYIRSKNMESTIFPLQDKARLALRTDGSRPEYGDYGTHLNYYAYGQSGMSLKVTDNNRIVIGAPGVLQWTGLLAEYSFRPTSFFTTRGHWTNPYYTMNLGPDDYFGYSVESGVFEDSGATLYVGGAPRSKQGYGQVIIYDPALTNENEPLKVKAHLEGPQLGAYFGSSLCAVDIDGDGLSDLLVGAPNFIKRDGILTFDQGAVFVYMSRKMDFRFHLQPAGYVTGSGENAARFGTSIAQLGDINADGYNDVAIGAPWENDGTGVVYIYKGTDLGLKNQYSQRIFAEGAKSFGISISKGYDVDKNNCNDLAIGAFNSGTAYLYRSIPTIRVMSLIKVPDAKNLKLTATNFTTLFCVTIPPIRSRTDVTIPLKATVLVDLEGNRAKSLGKTEYVVTAKPGLDICDEQVIQVNTSADFSKPISIKFNLEPVTDIDKLDTFPTKMARVSEDSSLQSSFFIQLLSECGDDLICTPWLEMTIEALSSEYIPGADSKLGAKITVLNTGEPAYSIKLHVSLPCGLKRLPRSCSLQNLDLTCDLPAPLKFNQTAEWEVELEYSWEGTDEQLKMIAVIEDPVYSRNISDEAKELVIPITPNSNYSFSWTAEPNRTITITRETFDDKDDVLFNHYYEVTNRGPSDLYHVEVHMILPEQVTLSTLVEGVTLEGNKLEYGVSSIMANQKAAFNLPMRFNYTFGDELDEKLVLNITTKAYFFLKNYHKSAGYNVTYEITTTLMLEKTTNLLLFLILSLVIGLLVLAAIIFALYKFGFFSRTKKEELKQLLENNSTQDETSSSLGLHEAGANHSQQEPLQCDSD